jgi:23S rRNA (uridine2552-2'-O)-methyltransferase
MIRKYQFMKAGDKVVDIGAAPGGWLQVSRQIVGKQGFVLGIDTEPISKFPWANIETILADVTDESTPSLILDRTCSQVDVVISDVSPKISGAWEVDHARQLHLAERSLEIAKRTLRRKGNFLCKLFHGPYLKTYESAVAEHFERVRFVKPPASKQKSSEIYILAIGFRG